jgi:plastocyanin
MSRTSFHPVVAALLVLSGFALMAFTHGSAVAADAAVSDVKLDNFTMSPKTLTVTVGTSVRWTNADDIPHTVVSEDRTFKSKVMDTDEHFTFTFSKAGTYKYFCSIHPHMTGTVIVK